MQHDYKNLTATYDVLGIGSAIVDILALVEDEFLIREALDKGGMCLIDAKRANELYESLGQCTECSGGSVANSLAAIASLGGKSAFIGRVHEDALGKIFTHDMRSVGVDYTTAPAKHGKPTARCMVCVTPDAQRTMATYIGASCELNTTDIDAQKIADSSIIYVEAYLWDLPEAKDAIRQAFAEAKKAGRKIAFTLSDSWCVDRHRADFLDFIAECVDVLFANEHEICALFETDDLELALEKITPLVDVTAVTLGERGSIVLQDQQRNDIPAQNISKLIDSTGAGDLFAAGFLYGITQGWSLYESAALGNSCAAEIIQQLGARPQRPLNKLVA